VKLAALDATNGFEGLQNIGSSILIYNNPALTSIGGFAALTTANAGISIHDNGAQTMSGFGAPTSVSSPRTISAPPTRAARRARASLARLEREPPRAKAERSRATQPC
jgi:hypothetical protein